MEGRRNQQCRIADEVYSYIGASECYPPTAERAWNCDRHGDYTEGKDNNQYLYCRLYGVVDIGDPGYPGPYPPQRRGKDYRLEHAPPGQVVGEKARQLGQ